MLVQAKTFAQQAPGTRALHRPSNLSARHHPHPGTPAFGQYVPIGHKAALGKAFPLLPNADKVPVLCNPRTPGQPQTFGRLSGHGAQIKPA